MFVAILQSIMTKKDYFELNALFEFKIFHFLILIFIILKYFEIK